MELRTKFLGLVVLCAAFDSGAMTLGRVRGAAIVGQPLDISLQVQLDPEESASALCADADVFYADNRQDASRVRVVVEAAQQNQSANLRVTSQIAIDEPIVTVYLRAGCSQKITRRYVLLADFPSEPAVPLITPSQTAPVVTMAPAANSAASTGAAPADNGSNWSSLNAPAANKSPPKPVTPAPARAEAKPVAKAAPRVKPAVVEKPVVVPAKPAAPAVAKAAPVAAPASSPAAKDQLEEKHAAGRTAGQSRLKLDPLVMLAERVASLESSSSVPTVEVLRETQKLESLEGSVKALLALAAKNEASLMDMKTRLQKAESERLPTEWFYGLVALVIACLAAIAFLFTRRRGGGDGDDDRAGGAPNQWWSESRGAALAASGAPGARESGLGQLSGNAALSPTAAQARQSVHQNLRDDPASEMDVSLVEMSESNFDNLMQSGQSHSALRRGPLPPPVEVQMTQAQPMQVAEPARSINSEQLFDVRQQAEFFVSLGQTDQAVRILENRISDNGESSPLIYLDLLKIFYTLGLKTDYRQFREDFNLLFNGRVPEFSSFKDEGKGLEEYPHVLAHIAALWPTPKVFKVIEASIFRDPLDEQSAPFDLAAFRDLLLLHAIAQSAQNPENLLSRPMPLVPVPSTNYMASPRVDMLAPGGSGNNGLNTQAGLQQVASPPAASYDELDLDLSDLEFSQPSAPSPLSPSQSVPLPSLNDDSLKTMALKVPQLDDNLLNFDLPDTGSSLPLPKPKPR